MKKSIGTWSMSVAVAAWAFLGTPFLPAQLTPQKITENAKKDLERLKDKRFREFKCDLFNALKARCGTNARTADEAGAAAWTSYTHLLPDQQDALEKEYPGFKTAAKKLADDQILTTEELTNMCKFLGIAPRAGAADPPVDQKRETSARTSRGTVTEHSVAVKDGNTVTRDTTINTPNATITGHEVTTRQDNSVTRDATVTGPNGTKTSQDLWTKNGDTVTRDGQTVRADGSTITRDDTWTKTGDTVQHNGTVTGPNGTTARQDKVVKDGNTVTQNSTLTRADGSVVSGSAVTVRDGNKVTRDATITGAGGTYIFHGVAIWTKNVWHTISSIIAPDGQKSSKETTVVRNGNTTSGHTVIHVPGGTVVRDSSTVKDGNTTVRDVTTSGDIAKANAWRAAAHQGLYFINESWNTAMSLFKTSPPSGSK